MGFLGRVRSGRRKDKLDISPSVSTIADTMKEDTYDTSPEGTPSVKSLASSQQKSPASSQQTLQATNAGSNRIPKPPSLTTKSSRIASTNTASTKSTDQEREEDNIENERVDNSSPASRKNEEMVENDDRSKASETSEESVPLREVDYDVNPTELYKLIEAKDWTQAIQRCNEVPEEASTWTFRYEENRDNTIDGNEKYIRWRMLPIHVAIMFDAPLKVITTLQKAHTQGIEAADDRKMLPIHLACRVVNNINVATFLIFNSTKSLKKTDYKGRTPMDILQEYRAKDVGKSKDQIDLFKVRNRETLFKLIASKTNQMPDNTPILSVSKDEVEVDYDAYPSLLIKMVERKMWQQAIQRCQEKPQEAATWMCRLQEVDSPGEDKKEVRWRILPIHSAIVLHAPVEVIEALVEAYPEGLMKGDDRKMLPLHMSFRLGSSSETAAVLVDAYPDALKRKDVKGHTPLHILRAYRRKYEKDRKNGKRDFTLMDKNRKALIKFYLGGRGYRTNRHSDDETLALYDSSSNESDDDSDSDESYDDDDDETYAGDLLYDGIFGDFGRLTYQGLELVKDTLQCQPKRY